MKHSNVAKHAYHSLPSVADPAMGLALMDSSAVPSANRYRAHGCFVGAVTLVCAFRPTKSYAPQPCDLGIRPGSVSSVTGSQAFALALAADTSTASAWARWLAGEAPVSSRALTATVVY